MQLKQHLADTFRFNDEANRQLIQKIKVLPDKQESVKFFSHIINCQFKWMARISKDPNEPQMNWWDPLYPAEHLEKKWAESLAPWLGFISSKTDKELSSECSFRGADGNLYAASPKDIILHLNYHSIHHRAQILRITREQGLSADVPDYIRTKFRRLS